MKVAPILTYVFFLLFSLSSHSSSFDFFKDVDKKTFKNGITVLLDETDSPVTAFYFWYDVGSSDENPNRTGLAHFFEHLMFKQSKSFEENYISKLMAKIGGRSNAFTTQDRTAYYEAVPFGKDFEKILKYEAHRMQNLVLTQKDIDVEKEVVKEEYRMRVGNSLFGQVFNKLIRHVYRDSNYRWPTIGSLEHLNQTTRQEFLDFYKKFYKPENLVVAVSGDFNKKKMLKEIEKNFASLKNYSAITKKPSWKPEVRRASKPKVISTKFKSNVFTLAYLTESDNSPYSLHLEMLAQILCEGDSSRLKKDLVYTWKKAQSVNCFQYGLEHEGMFIIQVMLNPKASWQEASTRVTKLIQSLAKETPVTQKEVEKARLSSELEVLSFLQTSQKRAETISYYESVRGDYKLMEKDYDKLLSLNRSEFKSLINKHFLVEPYRLIFKPK